MSNIYRNRSIERGFQILESLGSSIDGMSAPQISRATNLHRATVHRLLEVLCELGYAYKQKDSNKYWTGFSLHTFGIEARVLNRIKRLSAYPLRSLAFSIEETTFLGTLEGTQAHFLTKVETKRSVRIDLDSGDYMDAHASAIGKALMACLPDSHISQLYKNITLRAHSKKTITDVTKLLNHLARIRKRGYAVEDEEMFSGVRSLAAPLINPAGRAVAAIAITGPKHRITNDMIPKFGIEIVKIAKKIMADIATLPPTH